MEPQDLLRQHWPWPFLVVLACMAALVVSGVTMFFAPATFDTMLVSVSLDLDSQLSFYILVIS